MPKYDFNRCFPVNLLHIFRTLFYKKRHAGGLLLFLELLTDLWRNHGTEHRLIKMPKNRNTLKITVSHSYSFHRPIRKPGVLNHFLLLEKLNVCGVSLKFKTFIQSYFKVNINKKFSEWEDIYSGRHDTWPTLFQYFH